MRELRTILVVDDEQLFLRSIHRVLTHDGYQVRLAEGVAEAAAAIAEGVDLVLTDFRLRDGSGLDVARAAAAASPAPLVIAWSGRASASEAFQLAQAGVLEFLDKPVSLSMLRAALDRVRTRPPPAFDALVAAQVGVTPLHEVEGRVRTTMLTQALASSSESRSKTARLLGVSRQLVQSMTNRAVRPKRMSGGE
ncbi:MAG: response regulator [Deltaproteobacteria bacterium]|nr:response regulator [Deltaproteobacteria bacterium]